MADIDLDMDESDSESDSDEDEQLIRDVIEFCGGPDLIQIFGGTGSGKTEFILSVSESALEADKDVLFIDTERNLSDNDRVKGTDYIYIPDWDDLYAYISGKTKKLSDDPFGKNTTNSKTLDSGYDVVVVDSIGLPALMKYDEYSIEDDAEQFKVFQMLQYISGRLQKYAQANNSLIMVTNQPGSELGDDGGTEPFGDKSLFAFKELWRTYKKSSNEVQTTCEIEAHRSRQSGEGKKLFKLEIDNSGTDITDLTDEEAQQGEWA